MTDAARPAVPPPGSDLALAAGCRCPVLDNNHGAGMFEINGHIAYAYSSDCPLHRFGAELDDGDVELDKNG